MAQRYNLGDYYIQGSGTVMKWNGSSWKMLTGGTPAAIQAIQNGKEVSPPGASANPSGPGNPALASPAPAAIATKAAATKPPTPATPPAAPAGKWSETIKYPQDLADNTADYVVFEFYDYKPPYDGAVSQETNFVNKYNGAFADGEGLGQANDYPRIVIYMPEDISTSYSAKWGGREFGPLAGAGLALAGSVMNAEKGAMNNAAQQFANSANSLTQGILPYVGAKLVSEAMNKIPGMGGNVLANDILASTRGEILNPNTEVLYQGPDLRRFELNFKMHARNEIESNTIQQICTTFKKASLPYGKDRATNLIGVPKIVKVRFKHKDQPHKYVTQYKCVAIGNVNINYTPDGSWATFRSGAPVAVTLGLQFQELKLVYSEDIDKGF